MKQLKVAIIQKKALHLQLQASVDKALTCISEAAKNGASLIIFGETWLSGYPAWIDHCPDVALWNSESTKDIFAQMHRNSVDVGGEEIKQLCVAARENAVFICLGINEKVVDGIGSGTIYNSFVIINDKGELVNHHRKLVPTYTEKMLYGHGDATGLKTVDTAWGKLGGLICWEHWMPLSRQALHNENEMIHIALWPTVHEMHQIASRHYAFEGRCFVIAAGQMLQVKDFPVQLSLPEHLRDDPDKYILNGGSCVIDPKGNYLLEPQFDNEEILYCVIDDLDQSIKEKLTLDTTGHYSRWDIFDFTINRKRK